MSQPFDTIIALDFETAWGRKVELGFSCQTNEEYIRDPRFKAWGLSWKTVGTDEIPVWVRHDRIRRWAASIDWSRTAVVCQNTQFDGTILAWVYGIHPCFMFDTLAMGRALYGVEVGNSLKALAERFELPPKGDGLSPSENILDDLPFHVEQTLAEYCKHDTWLCEQIFLRMLPQFPSKELRLIDMTLRMYTRPLLRLDSEMLQGAIEEERTAREGLLQRLGVAEASLASNDQFAEVLKALGIDPPVKKSKTTGQETWAFAKNDALFQALVNSDNEEVALLCEARLKVKSTTERTRAQRFLDISTRGNLPVPLSYYGAATGRWTASKGSAINMQNLKRGSFLRKAIMAPEGHVLVVGDLSQIEPRVLAWLSDYDDLLNIFRKGGDPYAQFGAPMFGIPGMTKDSHPTQRQSAKSALLGCLSGDTPVLTNNGYKPMLEVQLTDLLWDGIEWVSHQGLVYRGEKETWTHSGLTATADHKILVGSTWREWQEVLTNPSLFQQALSSVALPASNGANAHLPADTVNTPLGCGAFAGTKGSQAKRGWYPAKQNAAKIAKTKRQARPLNTDLRNRFLSILGTSLAILRVQDGRQKTRATTPVCCAVADGKGLCNAPMSSRAHLHAATVAQNEKPLRRAGKSTDITAYAPMLHSVIGCLTASVQSLCAAPIRAAQHILIMADAASRYTLHGLKTVSSSCATSLGSMVGINPSFNLTASTTTAGMSLAICGSSPAARTWPTSGASLRERSKRSNSASPFLKQRMQTYDIAQAGPRNRYTILTDDGPLIVHNCGYQLGWPSFAAQLLTGFLGAPPKRYTRDEAKQLGVTGADVQKFLSWEENLKAMAEIPHTCSELELAIHCLAAKAIIDKYRATAAPVVGFWNLLGELIEHALYRGNEYQHKCLTFRKEEIVLPSGMSLRYPDLKPEDGSKGRVQWTYADGRNGKRSKLYPGKICNNVTQGTARCVMTDGMLRVAKRYPVVGTVHDEQIAVAPEAEKDEAKTWVLAQMIATPSYLPGIPLNADVGAHERYGLAKG